MKLLKMPALATLLVFLSTTAHHFTLGHGQQFEGDGVYKIAGVRGMWTAPAPGSFRRILLSDDGTPWSVKARQGGGYSIGSADTSETTGVIIPLDPGFSPHQPPLAENPEGTPWAEPTQGDAVGIPILDPSSTATWHILPGASSADRGATWRITAANIPLNGSLGGDRILTSVGRSVIWRRGGREVFSRASWNFQKLRGLDDEKLFPWATS